MRGDERDPVQAAGMAESGERNLAALHARARDDLLRAYGLRPWQVGLGMPPWTVRAGRQIARRARMAGARARRGARMARRGVRARRGARRKARSRRPWHAGVKVG